jgi:hypothetical protein
MSMPGFCFGIWYSAQSTQYLDTPVRLAVGPNDSQSTARPQRLVSNKGTKYKVPSS